MVVVFDTSVYRSLTQKLDWKDIPERVKEIKRGERTNGHIAHFSPTALMELSAHLSHEDPEREACTRALAFLVRHVEDEDRDFNLWGINEAYNIVLMALFGLREEKVILMTEELARI